MPERIASRWWLIALTALIGLVGGIAVTRNQAQRYTGRADLVQIPPARRSEKAILELLNEVARSNSVMADAADTLVSQGVNAEDTMKAASIQPVGRRALQVRVELADRASARKAEEVIAATLCNVWTGLSGTTDGWAAATGYDAAPVSLRQGVRVELRRNKLISAIRPPSISISEVVRLATSKQVMKDAAATLKDLGSSCSDKELRSATAVRGLKATGTIMVEVMLPDPIEAKKAADVVSASLKSSYYRLLTARHANEKSSLRTINPAYVYVAKRGLMREALTGFGIGLAIGIVLGAVFPGPERKV